MFKITQLLMDDTMPSGAFDRPEEKEFRVEHVLGDDNIEIPDSVLLMTKADNQGKTPACTCYSTYHVGRILNEIEHNKELDGMPDRGWELQKKFGTYSKNGDYVQTALKSIVKNGLHCEDEVYKINAYARVSDSALSMKRMLAQGMPLVTSARVTKTNFKKAKYDGVWTGNDGDAVTGHAFAIIGYKNGYFIALNSYGDNWGYFGNGTFKIKETDVISLNSMYVLYDSKDVKKIYKDVSEDSVFAEEILWCLDEGIMNGYDADKLPPEDRYFMPEKGITRGEIAVVMKRLFNKLK